MLEDTLNEIFINLRVKYILNIRQRIILKVNLLEEMYFINQSKLKMKYQLFLGILISLNFFLSCSKSETQRSLNPTLLDSVIMATSNLNFIYDSQNRVVQERLVGNDTLREENTYVYNGTDSSPFMRTHINHSSNLNFVSYFTYNTSGYKVRDSTYYFSSGSSIISVINYSITQKICVLQNQL